MTRRALVTGATGFLGHHLALSLMQAGWDVVAVLRAQSVSSRMGETLRANGAQIAAFDAPEEVQAIARESRANVAFHLATHYLKTHVPSDVTPLLEANVTFGVQLLEGLHGSSTRVVNAASYFQFLDGSPTPVSLYSATKQAMFDIAEYYRVVGGLDLTHAVLFDTFGPGDTRSKLVPQLISALDAGGHVALGPSRQQLNLLYVDDVVSGLLAASQGGHEPVVALRASANVTVGDLVSMLNEVSGRELTCSYNDTNSPNDLLTRAGSWPAPQGWEPKRSLREGMELTWRSRMSTAGEAQPALE